MIFYNNINFYENLYDYRLDNKAHIVNHIVGYIYFINTPDSHFFPYINYKNIDYNIVKSFMAKNFLLVKIGYNHCSITMYYILGYILEKYFGMELKT